MHVMSARVCMYVRTCVYVCVRAWEREKDATEVTCDFLLFYFFFVFFLIRIMRIDRLFCLFISLKRMRDKVNRDCLPHDFVA